MKRIGSIVYNSNEDCCMVRYNGDVFYRYRKVQNYISCMVMYGCVVG